MVKKAKSSDKSALKHLKSLEKHEKSEPRSKSQAAALKGIKRLEKHEKGEMKPKRGR